MNAKISVFVICGEAIIYLMLYNLRDCTFNGLILTYKLFEARRNVAIGVYTCARKNNPIRKEKVIV